MPAPESTERASDAVDATRWLAVASVLGLIALGLAWELWLAPSRSGFWAAARTLPLCLPLAGLLRMRMYTYRWLSLLVWLYFADGATRAYRADAPTTAFALTEVALSLMLFAACALHVRIRHSKAPS